MEKKITAIRGRLKEHKLTPQRRAVLEVILENEDKHLSAEEIYAFAREKDPEIGLATIYRALDLLSELNILHKLNFGDGRSRYEPAQFQAGHHHHHLVCLDCGNITEVKEDLLHQLEALIVSEHSFKIINHSVKFFGYCNSCADIKTKPKKGGAL